MHADSFRDLDSYRLARRLADEIFVTSKDFPREELYALTDQIRRHSRSVGARIAEAWANRGSKKHFVSKLTDADSEQLETHHWIETALACNYIDPVQSRQWLTLCASIGRMLNSMMTNADQFCTEASPASCHQPAPADGGTSITDDRATPNARRSPVIFCGAGPGDPELITVKGRMALASADLILYAGSLVPEAVLVWARPAALRISSASMTLEQIIDTMAAAHHAGRQVVRLHTGDPSLYGAIMEQMALLRARDIPYRVIPGVTAAFAAAAALGLEYTVPEVTQTLILTRMAGRTPVPEAEALASLARHQSSMVIYLSMALIDDVAAILAGAYGPEAPCAIAYRVSHPEERILSTTVSDLPATARHAGITRHAVIMVGPALEQAPAAGTLRSKLYDKDFFHGCRQA